MCGQKRIPLHSRFNSKISIGGDGEWLGQSLVAAHKLHVCDFAARFGIASSTNQTSAREQSAALATERCCDKCSAAIDTRVVKYCRTTAIAFRGRSFAAPARLAPRSAQNVWVV